MNLGQWLNSLSTTDHIVLLLLYGSCIYLSKITLQSFIELYDNKKKYSEFRIKLRITPIALLSLGLFYSILVYQILDAMFGFMP